MASSAYERIPAVIKLIRKFGPRSVLDIGIGFGKYGLLIRENLDVRNGRYWKRDWRIKIDGVESFPSFITPVHEYLYDNIYLDNVMNLVKEEKLECYDIYLMIAVIEHLTKKDGQKLLDYAYDHSKLIIVGIPYNLKNPASDLAQKVKFGNVLEAHQSLWRIFDFERFGNNCKLLEQRKKGATFIISKG